VKKEKLVELKSSLKAINDFVIINEDKVDYEVDVHSGLTSEVVDSLKSGLLVAPERTEHYVKKFPCTGTIISFGRNCINKDILSIGMKVMFPKMGVCREIVDGVLYTIVRSDDIHAIIS